MYTDIRQKNSAVLKLSYTAFQVTSCNSGLTFARILVQSKKWGVGGRVPPVEKVGDAVPPPHYTPDLNSCRALVY